MPRAARRLSIPQSKRQELSKDDFFFVAEDNYDQHVDKAIPLYREMHAEAVRLAVVGGEPPRQVLDLGSGTGKTAEVFLRTYPGAEVTCVELFDEMQRHARARLAPFAGRVTHVQGDFMEVPLGHGFDVCVSVLAIHHQSHAGKGQLFRRIHDALSARGRFVMVDWTKFETSALQDLSFLVAHEHLTAHVSNHRIVEEWADHWRNKNTPDSTEELLAGLGSAGFDHSDVVMRHYGLALIYASKHGG